MGVEGGERRHHHLGFAGVGPMGGFAVVPEGFLGEALRVAASAGAFRPRVAVGMERHPLDVQGTGPLHELGRPVPGPNRSQVGEERARGCQHRSETRGKLPV